MPLSIALCDATPLQLLRMCVRACQLHGHWPIFEYFAPLIYRSFDRMTASIVDFCDPDRRTTSCVFGFKAHGKYAFYLNRNNKSTSTFRASSMFRTSVWAHIQPNYRRRCLGNTHCKRKNSAILCAISIIYRISFVCGGGGDATRGGEECFFAHEMNATIIFRCSHSANLIIDYESV